jgi:hypothetical protein
MFGTVLEGSALRTVEELDAAIIGFAVGKGMPDPGFLDSEAADSAIEWLNEHDENHGHYMLDDGLIYVDMVPIWLEMHAETIDD